MSIVWNTGTPPKRGVYAVKSDGPSSNMGYRYWNGDRWSPLCARRAIAASWGKNGTHRKTPLRYAVLWASKAPAPPCCVACGQPIKPGKS